MKRFVFIIIISFYAYGMEQSKDYLSFIPTDIKLEIIKQSFTRSKKSIRAILPFRGINKTWRNCVNNNENLKAIIEYMASYIRYYDIFKIKDQFEKWHFDLHGLEVWYTKKLVDEVQFDLLYKEVSDQYESITPVSENFKSLLNSFDINKPLQSIGYTLLYAALVFENYDHAKLLLLKNADVNKACKWGKTPMHIITKENANADVTGVDEMLDLVLQKNPNLNVQDRRGRTPLMSAVKYGSSTGFVKKIVEKKQNFNLQNHKGKTALMIAVDKRDYDVVKLLLKANARIDIKDHDENTALHLARNALQGYQGVKNAFFSDTLKEDVKEKMVKVLKIISLLEKKEKEQSLKK